MFRIERHTQYGRVSIQLICDKAGKGIELAHVANREKIVGEFSKTTGISHEEIQEFINRVKLFE